MARIQDIGAVTAESSIPALAFPCQDKKFGPPVTSERPGGGLDLGYHFGGVTQRIESPITNRHVAGWNPAAPSTLAGDPTKIIGQSLFRHEHHVR